MPGKYPPASPQGFSTLYGVVPGVFAEQLQLWLSHRRQVLRLHWLLREQRDRSEPLWQSSPPGAGSRIRAALKVRFDNIRSSCAGSGPLQPLQLRNHDLRGENIAATPIEERRPTFRRSFHKWTSLQPKPARSRNGPPTGNPRQNDCRFSGAREPAVRFPAIPSLEAGPAPQSSHPFFRGQFL